MSDKCCSNWAVSYHVVLLLSNGAYGETSGEANLYLICRTLLSRLLRICGYSGSSFFILKTSVLIWFILILLSSRI